MTLAQDRANDRSSTQSPGKATSEQIQQAGTAAKEKLQQAGGDLRSQAEQASEEVQKQAREALHQVQTTGADYANRKKERVADECSVISNAISQAAESLREQDHQGAAGYVDAVARQIEQCGNTIARKDWRDMYRDTEALARRRPELFYGGLFVAGLAAMRFLKATSEPDEQAQAMRRSDQGQRRERSAGPRRRSPESSSRPAPRAGSSLAQPYTGPSRAPSAPLSGQTTGSSHPPGTSSSPGMSSSPSSSSCSLPGVSNASSGSGASTAPGAGARGGEALVDPEAQRAVYATTGRPQPADPTTTSQSGVVHKAPGSSDAPRNG